MKHIASRLVTSVVIMLSFIVVLTTAFVSCEESVPAFDVTPSHTPGNGGGDGNDQGGNDQGGSGNEGGSEDTKPFLTVNPQSLTFDAEGGDAKSFIVTTNTIYSVSSKASWIDLSQAGNDWTVTADANLDEEARQDSIIVAAGALRQVIKLQQLGKAVEYTLSIDKTMISAGCSAHADSVHILGNDIWTATPSDEWITLSATSGIGEQQLYVSLTANEQPSVRTGNVMIIGEKSGAELLVNVNQSGTAYDFSVNVSSLEAGSSADTRTFQITTNDAWVITTSESWISVSASQGSGSRLITVNLSENTTTDTRTGRIDITGTNSGSTARISVSQSGKYLTLDSETLSFAPAGGTKSLNVNTDGTFQASTSESWLTVSTSGSRVNVVAEANAGSTSRNGTVTVSLTGLTSGSISRVISISQTGEDYDLSVDKTSLSFDSNSGSKTFTITSNDSWTASSNVSWATLSSTSGSGNKTITVSCSANGDPEQRSGTITVKGANSQTVTISVSQSGVGYSLSVDKTSLSFDSNSGSKTFTITSNDSWTASSNVTWATLSSTSGNGNKTITVSCSANSDPEQRSGTITVKGANSQTVTISVSQSGVGYSLSVDKTSLSFDSNSGSKTFTITSNDSWTASTNVSWATLSSTSGSGNKTITVSCSANGDPEQRSGTITVKGTNSQTVTISVTQTGVGFSLSVDKTSLNFDSTSGSKTFTITSNDSWTASSNVSWATLSSTSGSGNKTITVSCTANSDPEQRSGTITVKGANSQTVTISVSQSGVGYSLSVDKTSLSFDSTSGSKTFTITSNDSWTASSNVSWATLSSTSGSGNKTITVSCTANTNTTERTGTITIQGDNSGSKTISVGQLGKPSGYDNGHEYVDLGLPSGLLWATCNVGANSPEEYGDYFAWGETEPKSEYNWSTYFDTNDVGYTFQKYNNNNGGKTVLEPADDAAHVNWGGSWRMPTYEELDELKTKCTWEWTTQNGVNGRKVTGPNGNSLFLPAAGYRGLSSLYSAGSGGRYWSSSLWASYSSYAYYLGFDSDGVYWDCHHRSAGRSVRPVR